MEAVQYLFYAVSVSYVFLIGYYALGWLRLRPCPTHAARLTGSFGQGMPVTGITIVVPARNEEKNLGPCLRSLCSQDYPTALFEVVVADDHSEDATAEVFHEAVRAGGYGNCRLSRAVPGRDKAGKKHTLERAVAEARFDVIAVTDADCRAGKDWLRCIAGCYEASRPVLMAGPVCLTGTGFFESLQVLEYAGLTASAAGAIANGSPLMCSAANMAFERRAFLDAGGYKGNDRYASGDDVFLLMKMRRLKGRTIAFLKSPGATVHSPAVPDPAGLAAQRIRWASKIRGFSGAHILFSAALVYFANLLLLLSVILTLFFPAFAGVLLVQVVLKASIDFFLLYLILAFYGKRRLLLLLIPGEFLNAVQVVMAGTAVFPGRYIWKGRRH